ncbi:ribosomal lysine N-methyltransferase 3 [Cinnamomum micranthum f. kanehirae]|uniref:Ribosomal lysine N-methyltransferase 3 n=1 Tax=Cinnamomum micranthum f. kanehirae TaxID=337451 RepID=A0A443PPJ0_9MAGN|nr:ribosomal lysine N-methyltransferase 3 [Cinnamomum micranthum f. kanehirae]
MHISSIRCSSIPFHFIICRRLRSFKRWMRSQRIDFSNALELIEEDDGISVRALCDLKEGDLVATIPKSSCLTIKTSVANEMIEEAGLDGSLGLSVALMYEKSLGCDSVWDGYLQLLPERESVPLVWSLEEVDSFLLGTELHKIVKEDRTLLYEDWKECILPLIESGPLKLNPNSFGVEQYFAAKTLVTSRSFEIDDYHGYGMVPLADLFNHKTGAENVHITSIASNSELGYDSDSDNDNDNECNNIDNEEPSSEDLGTGSSDHILSHLQPSTNSSNAIAGLDSLDANGVDSSLAAANDPMVLEMIVVKEVKEGDEDCAIKINEYKVQDNKLSSQIGKSLNHYDVAVAHLKVFNTYGLMGNAALLHRYGFTELDNPFDIVNIDLNLVEQWIMSSFSNRYFRSRLSLWRRLGCTGCISQSYEYFEISSDGEPQLDLLVLLYIIFLPDEAYQKLSNITISFVENVNKSINILLSTKNSRTSLPETPEKAKVLLLTERVRAALVSLADSRENFYGSNSLKDDMKALSRCCRMQEKKLYHSLVLRVSERMILKKLRSYASQRGKGKNREMKLEG